MAYNLGRIATYCALGAVFGVLGQTIALGGYQRGISIVAGIAILAGLIASRFLVIGGPAVKAVVWLKAGFARVLQRRTISSVFMLGLLNGLLPCGLVYVAGAAAGASGSTLSSVGFMFAFGLGTTPMMLGLGLAAGPLKLASGLKLQRLVPVSIAVVGLLLILRGLDLGIPYVSPHLGSAPHSAAAPCH
jgi:sulfite exporter TauE/SafE